MPCLLWPVFAMVWEDTGGSSPVCESTSRVGGKRRQQPDACCIYIAFV